MCPRRETSQRNKDSRVPTGDELSMTRLFPQKLKRSTASSRRCPYTGGPERGSDLSGTLT